MRKKLLGNRFHLIPHYALLIQLIEFNSLCLLAISKLFQKPLSTVNWKHSCSSFYTRVCNLINQESIKTNDFNTTQVHTSLSISIFTYVEIFKIYPITPSFDSKSQDQNHLINGQLIRNNKFKINQTNMKRINSNYHRKASIVRNYITSFSQNKEIQFMLKIKFNINEFTIIFLKRFKGK